MKCDELKEIMLVNQVSGERTPSGTYKKAEVDAAIAELKAKNKRLEELKDKYSSCAEKAIDSIAKCELKIRRLSRALFKACANWAYATENTTANFLDVDEAKKWAAVYARCIKKAEEYK